MSAATTTDFDLRAANSLAHDASSAVLICLGPAYEAAPIEDLAPLAGRLREAFSGLGVPVTVAFPTFEDSGVTEHAGLRMQPYRPVESTNTIFVQTAGSYLSAYDLLREHSSNCCVLLGAEGETLDVDGLRLMVEAILSGRADLAMPRYALGPEQGLLNSAMLSPLSRAIYGLRLRYPLAIDMAMSARMAERMSKAAQSLVTNAQADAVLWPVAEAATAGFAVAEVNCGPRDIPPSNMDLSAILNNIGGSLFSDIEAKASFWQRSRPAQTVLSAATPLAGLHDGNHHAPAEDELLSMIQTYRLGYRDLHEIWSLILPPNTLLGLKRLSAVDAEQFTLPDTLWTRVVYDFVLAHRLRTLNRGHLLGAFTPLYLAWVASHLQASRRGADAEAHVEQLAKTFEADKPYLVSRWRWPDRFNP